MVIGMSQAQTQIQEQKQVRLFELVQELMRLPVKVKIDMTLGLFAENDARHVYIDIYVPVEKVKRISMSDDYGAIIIVNDGNDTVRIDVTTNGIAITPISTTKYRNMELKIPLHVHELELDSENKTIKIKTFAKLW